MEVIIQTRKCNAIKNKNYNTKITRFSQVFL